MLTKGAAADGGKASSEVSFLSSIKILALARADTMSMQAGLEGSGPRAGGQFLKGKDLQLSALALSALDWDFSRACFGAVDQAISVLLAQGLVVAALTSSTAATCTYWSGALVVSALLPPIHNHFASAQGLSHAEAVVAGRGTEPPAGSHVSSPAQASRALACAGGALVVLRPLCCHRPTAIALLTTCRTGLTSRQWWQR